jgi:hypothetical protein
MKLSINFLNRWEYAALKKYNAEHTPVAKTVVSYAAATAVVSVIVMFVVNLFTDKSEVFTVLLGVFAVSGLVASGLKTLSSLKLLSSVVVKIVYAAVMLALYAAVFWLAMILAVWTLIIAICLVIFYFILVYGYGNGRSGGKATMHYSDGSSEEAEMTGKGVLGETYYKGKDSGNTFIDP